VAEPLIVVEPVGDGVLLVRMQSAPVNAWTDDFTVALEAVADELASTRARAIVITGSGAHFSAGGDFHLFQTVVGEEAARAFVTRAQRVMDKIAAIPCPVIAAVNGTALGGGLELALACDIRIAVPGARLGLPETRWGILAGAGGTQRLARLIGPGAAKLMMYSARPVDGVEALRLGLVERLDADALAAALELAEQIAGNSPRAVRSVKRCVDEGLQESLDEGLRIERELWIDLIPDGDLQEGAQAFFERRAPVYGDWPREG
jgi:enoyl-CoA hydratase/carnithine racemase